MTEQCLGQMLYISDSWSTHPRGVIS